MDTQFKPWLIKQISSGKFLDLEWIDSEKKRVFKLPWTKKNYPHWEEHHEIFKAWAKHRAEIKNEPEALHQHISLMKSNFRTIINKCQEIEEQTNLHQLGLQMGNYKVYKILEPEEARMKRQLMKSMSTSSDHSEDIVEIRPSNGTIFDINNIAGPPNISDDWIRTSGSLGVALLQNRPETEAPSPTIHAKPPKPKRKRVHEPKVEDPHFKPREIIFVNNDSNDNSQIPIEMEGIETVTTTGIEPETEMVVLTEDNMAGFQILLDAAEMAAEVGQEAVLGEIQRQRSDVTLNCLLKLLEECNIPAESMYSYELSVKYEENLVLEETLEDVSGGYRIHHGDHTSQQWYLQLENDANGTPDHRLADFQREPVTLPMAHGVVSEAFDKVLQNTDAGVVLKAEDDFTLWGKRLCQSRVYAFTSFGLMGDPDVAIQMNRDVEIPLFSYARFYEAWLPYAQRKVNTLPEFRVQLAFGRKPRNRSTKVFISAVLIPKAAAALMERTEQSFSNDGPEISITKSLDNAIRLCTASDL